jgi:TRAP-type uncharacterized transport system substrate-binding protein
MRRYDLRKLSPAELRDRFTTISWRDLAVTLGPILVLSVIAIWATFRFVRPAPPDTITITSGPIGSTLHNTAEKYRKILARHGVTLTVLPSQGSLENLHRLIDPSFRVDIGFLQGGITAGANIDNLVSLGSVFYEPVRVFYSGAGSVDRLSQFGGRRLTIGPEGSGTRFLALALLKANGIEPGGPTTLLDLDAEDAAEALLEGTVDAVLLTGDSAAPPLMRKLLRAPGIQLMDFPQADAYTRRFHYLSKLVLPMGAFDFAANLPSRDVTLIGPTVELVAREDLHPALSDLLIEAAREVHGRAGLLHSAGEFPSPLEHEIRISDDASRYYKSGKGFLYRHLPFWVASLADRMLWILVPIVALVIPGLRMVPMLYRWRIRSRIYRCYGALLALERDILANPGPGKRQELMKKLDEIDRTTGAMKMPVYFADQFYVLREHIGWVRGRLTDDAASQGTA